MSWLPHNARWQVGAALLSCGHIMWIVEPDGMTVDEMADMRGDRRCWQCRSRIDGRLVIPTRRMYAVRPAFRTFQEHTAARRSPAIKHPRWR
jgi:hypothetical protein